MAPRRPTSQLLVPKLAHTLRGYDRSQFLADLGAGVIVGVVALPLAVAFAIASGVTPDRGLATAIVGGLLISALGGSRVQIGGPTGAFVVVVYGIVQQHGVDGLLVATLMAGLMLVAFGFLRFGAAIKFIPFPVTTGFTSGIALIIFSGQIKDFLGLNLRDVPAAFVPRWAAYATALPTLNPWAVLVAGGSLMVLVWWPRMRSRIPGPLVVLLAATAAVRLFHLPVETVADRFGALHGALPHPHLPDVNLAMVPGLVAPAFTIAMLGAIEALLSAVVADGMIGGRHRSNMELIAQGAANVVVPLFGGIPATGAIARTATNIKNGGRTPVAGIVHALTLLVIVLFAGRLVGMVPLAALAAILVVVAYHMSEWRTVAAELRAPTSDVAVLLTTLGLTVLWDLTVAIPVGLVLAAFLFMRRMAELTDVSALQPDLSDEGMAPSPERLLPPGVRVYEVNGPFFFGAADRFTDALGQVGERPDVLVLRLRHVPMMDTTGLRALRDATRKLHREGTRVFLADVQRQPMDLMRRSGFADEIGTEHLYLDLDAALARARDVTAPDGQAAARRLGG